LSWHGLFGFLFLLLTYCGIGEVYLYYESRFDGVEVWASFLTLGT
jgi:hypothetical protein